MAIQSLAFRSPATRIPFAPFGSRFARQARRRGSCCSRPRQNSGKWTRRVARHPTESSVTRPVDAQSVTANSSMPRSEEHTSELQSLTNLVCRLLLEKKKNKKNRQSELQDRTTLPQN